VGTSQAASIQQITFGAKQATTTASGTLYDVGLRISDQFDIQNTAIIVLIEAAHNPYEAF
jgi:hypothetical protein